MSWEDYTKAERDEVLDPLRARAAKLRVAAFEAERYCVELRERIAKEPPLRTLPKDHRVVAKRSRTYAAERLATETKRAKDATRAAEGLEELLLWIVAKAEGDATAEALRQQAAPGLIIADNARRNGQDAELAKAFLGQMQGKMQGFMERTLKGGTK